MGVPPPPPPIHPLGAHILTNLKNCSFSLPPPHPSLLFFFSLLFFRPPPPPQKKIRHWSLMIFSPIVPCGTFNIVNTGGRVRDVAPPQMCQSQSHHVTLGVTIGGSPRET